jgi:hypothetical protein
VFLGQLFSISVFILHMPFGLFSLSPDLHACMNCSQCLIHEVLVFFAWILFDQALEVFLGLTDSLFDISLSSVIELPVSVLF